MEINMRGSLPDSARTSSATGEHSRASGRLSIFANKLAAWSGKPAAFLGAPCLVIVWGVTGPISHSLQRHVATSDQHRHHHRDVPDGFLDQSTQNRDTLALQVKLAELIIAFQKADGHLALIEEVSDDELQKIHEDLKIKEETAANSESKEHPEAQNA
jgi:low affinity Fe/Cu permease